MNIASIDLNLLVALDVLLDEQNVTNAGRRIGLSQPAMSNVLARLRQTLNDPILVRTSRGMTPTPRALELVVPIRRALTDLDRALSDVEEFEPEKAERSFKLTVMDHTSVVLLPKLVERLVRIAPRIDLELCPFRRESTFEDLENGSMDAAVSVGPVESPRAGIYRRRLYDDNFVCLVREGHPSIKKRLTLKRYLELSHVLVSPSGGKTGLVDQALAERGLARRVAVVVPHFVAAPLLVAATDMIVTLSRGVALPFAKLLPLNVHPVPVQLSGGPWQLLWHERTHLDPAHAWLRNQIVELSQEVAAQT